MKILNYIALCLILQGAGNLAGQELLHKASKVDERTYVKGISKISIRGEKASVSLQGWNRSEVKVLLRPVSRNTDKEQAIADLKYIRYDAIQEGNLLVITNSFEGELEQFTSNLSMEIEVLVPFSMPAQITNLYGPVQIENLASVSANVSFGSLSLTSISSNCSIAVRYSDIELNSISGKLDIKAEKSDIRAKTLSGTSTINCSYGEAHLALVSNGNLAVKAYRTGLTVEVDVFEKFRYLLDAKGGNINLPQGKKIRDKVVNIQPAGASGQIDLSTSYCDISIITK